MRRLREHPVGAWTYGRTVGDVVNSLYNAAPGWSYLAARLQILWQGRAPDPTPPPPAPPVPNPNPYTGEEQAAAVFCGESPNPRDPGAYHALAEASARRAGDAGRFWAWAGEPCATWPAVAANGYRGPWNKPTAHPVLVIGTTYDPATPYSGAQALAKELAHGRLLTHHGYGHTELTNPSTCVHAYESRYLIDGTLPPPGAACRQDIPPFAAPVPAAASPPAAERWPAGSPGPAAAPRAGSPLDAADPSGRPAYSVLTTTVRMTLSAKVWPFASHAGHR
ncbi:hypothetical protein Srufu_042570 [Streptomyces libani subsp. rufus]|nr:hypothetical protein Srufu_042570 [Streptomyces libani subsp. rufus]